jgi:predicted DNA binding CopG/RHH family protein
MEISENQDEEEEADDEQEIKEFKDEDSEPLIVEVKKSDVQLALMIVDELINRMQSHKIENY